MRAKIISVCLVALILITPVLGLSKNRKPSRRSLAQCHQTLVRERVRNKKVRELQNLITESRVKVIDIQREQIQLLEFELRLQQERYKTLSSELQTQRLLMLIFLMQHKPETPKKVKPFVMAFGLGVLKKT